MDRKIGLIIITVLAVCSTGWSYTVSGTVIDRDTLLPLDQMRIFCWNQDLEAYTETLTLADGSYTLTVDAGRCDLQVLPDSIYARMGRTIDITGDLSGQDFALGPEAIVSGCLIDIDTAEPVGYQTIWYWSDQYSVWQYDDTDADGTFELRALPPGVGEFEARPDGALGYSEDLPGQFRRVDLAEGETRHNVFISARKGALVTGQIVDVNGVPIAEVAVDIMGDNGDAWLETNVNGEFQVRLVPGTYVVQPESNEGEGDPMAAIPVVFEIPNLSPVTVAPITCYTESTGGQISGTVELAAGSVNTGYLGIAAFVAGSPITPATFNTDEPAIFVLVDPDGPFTITALPPGSYDLHMVQFNEVSDEVESYTILDSAMGVAVGTTNVTLSNAPGSITVNGTLENLHGLPVFLGKICLERVSGPEPRLEGFVDTNTDGSFELYNFDAGDYVLSILHPGYSFTTMPVTISGPVSMDIGTVTVNFSGVKEAADLDGDGIVNLGDVSTLGNQWLTSGPTADFNESGRVDLEDFVRIAKFWMWKTLWLND